MTSKIKSLATILWIGLVAGTLDITDNLIFNQLRGITPRMVFQYIASGLIGVKAFRVGLASVVLGVAIHYTIALIWTGVFYAASRKLAILSRRPVLSGLVYGGAIYLFMNFIILPLSRVPHPRSAITLASRINGVLALLLFIGLPISLLMRRSLTQAVFLPVRTGSRDDKITCNEGEPRV
jgi:uncharacterized membrane protein YagU involved in acid resistance